MPRPSLAFIHNRPVGAAEANVGAVLQMAAAFGRAGAQVDLTLYEGGEHGDPFARHGVDRTLRLHLQRERSGPLSYPVLVIGALAGGGEVVYTRVPQVALYAMALGRRAILEMHTPIGALRRGERLRRALDLAAPRLAGLVAISPALDAELRAELPRFAGPRIVAPSAAADLSAPPDAPPPDHDLGYVGGLSPGKGGEMVLALAERLPRARVLLAGDAARHPELKARAAALPNVTLLGAVPPSGIAAVLARFRIGLAPYGTAVTGAGASGIDLAPWMSPLKVAEYASAGKATAAAALPAVRAMVSDGVEAALFPSGDLDGWAAGLEQLLARPQEVRRLGAAARAAWRARLSWDGRARGILQACGLLDQPSG
jgi:glycosyltransferase involved in cell wall biosynthesis